MPGDIRVQAVDFRTNDLGTVARAIIGRELSDRLGTVYDIVWEDTHLHIEYDPGPAVPYDPTRLA